MIASAQQLISDIEKKRKNWDEHSQFTIKGIGNLSLADLDSLVLYATAFIRGEMHMFMKPMGAIKEVLMEYGIAV